MSLPGLSRAALGRAPFEAPQFYLHGFTIILQYLPGCSSVIHVAPTIAPALPASAVQPVAQTVVSQQVAVVQFLTGPNAGKELELIKNLTTLGKPGLQVAVLTRRPQGYFITHVEGEKFPLVNGRTLTNQAHQLKEHDVIELAGVKMEFYFKG